MPKTRAPTFSHSTISHSDIFSPDIFSPDNISHDNIPPDNISLQVYHSRTISHFNSFSTDTFSPNSLCRILRQYLTYILTKITYTLLLLQKCRQTEIWPKFFEKIDVWPCFDVYFINLLMYSCSTCNTMYFDHINRGIISFKFEITVAYKKAFRAATEYKDKFLHA